MDREFLEELFAPFAPIEIKPMFGELGISYRGLMFAGIMDGVLRLKADDETKADFELEGMKPWQYTYKSGKKVVVGYWQVPEYLLDDPTEFRPWAEKAFQSAMRSDAAKPASKRKLEQF